MQWFPLRISECIGQAWASWILNFKGSQGFRCLKVAHPNKSTIDLPYILKPCRSFCQVQATPSFPHKLAFKLAIYDSFSNTLPWPRKSLAIGRLKTFLTFDQALLLSQSLTSLSLFYAHIFAKIALIDSNSVPLILHLAHFHINLQKTTTCTVAKTHETLHWQT